jgi:hypothetical protein
MCHFGVVPNLLVNLKIWGQKHESIFMATRYMKNIRTIKLSKKKKFNLRLKIVLITLKAGMMLNMNIIL